MNFLMYVNMVILLIFEFPELVDFNDKNLSTLEILTEGGVVCTTFEGYTTIYKQVNNTVTLSNDGSVYTEPEVVITEPEVVITEPEVVITEPEVIYTPTLEEIKLNKINELNTKCEQAITGGIISKAYDGITEAIYDSTRDDQLNINGLVAIAQLRLGGLTDETLKWKTSSQTVCVEYTPESILLLGLDMKRHIENCLDKYHNLKAYVISLATVDEVNAVTWDTELSNIEV